MTKQEKIDLMVETLMKGIQMPIIFDPYENATDCLMLWNKFSLGMFVEICSYPSSDACNSPPPWVARRHNKRYMSNLEVSAKGCTMLKAMCECMVEASKMDINSSNINSSNVNTTIVI